MHAVVMVTVPEASVTQKGVGVLHALLTERESFCGRVEALAYATRIMFAAQTCTFILPLPTVKVTPVASAV
jgi:hypothetical protein